MDEPKAQWKKSPSGPNYFQEHWTEQGHPFKAVNNYEGAAMFQNLCKHCEYKLFNRMRPAPWPQGRQLSWPVSQQRNHRAQRRGRSACSRMGWLWRKRGGQADSGFPRGWSWRWCRAEASRQSRERSLAQGGHWKHKPDKPRKDLRKPPHPWAPCEGAGFSGAVGTVTHPDHCVKDRSKASKGQGPRGLFRESVKRNIQKQ